MSENIWGILVRKIYVNGVQFSPLLELENELFAAWETVTPIYIRRLVESMPNRIIMCLDRKGGNTNY